MATIEMNTKLLTIISAFALIMLGLGLLAAPARADDAAARVAVMQSFLAMRSVYSFRDKWFIYESRLTKIDMSCAYETTKKPHLAHKFFTFGPDKSETIATANTLYTHEKTGRWTAKLADHPWNGPWNGAWVKRYDPTASYLFLRHDVLVSVPVDVYTYTTRTRDGIHTDGVIWIGTRDHLPRKIVHRTINASGTVQSALVETLYDFNAPIKITVPDVPTPNSSQK